MRRAIKRTGAWACLWAAMLIGVGGCASSNQIRGRPFERMKCDIGRTTRAEVLQMLGPPQLFDYTRAGEVGSNYLVYEYRTSNLWIFSPVPFLGLINYIGNSEKTKTMVFYFDDGGILRSMGYSENQPTTSRSGFSILYPWGLEEVVK